MAASLNLLPSAWARSGTSGVLVSLVMILGSTAAQKHACGDFTFDTTVNVPIGLGAAEGPGMITAADVNNDGLADVIAPAYKAFDPGGVHPDPVNWSLFLNTPSNPGTFQTAHVFERRESRSRR